MPNYFFNPKEYPAILKMDDPRHDYFLFNQGPTRGLSEIQFHDFNMVFNKVNLPNINIFKEQIAIFRESLMMASPSEAQRKDVDFLLTAGEMFALVVYGQLILENTEFYKIDDDLLDQIFDCLVRDFSKFALELYHKPSSTPQQMEYCLKIIRKPAVDERRYQSVWEQVHALNNLYEMNP